MLTLKDILDLRLPPNTPIVLEEKDFEFKSPEIISIQAKKKGDKIYPDWGKEIPGNKSTVLVFKYPEEKEGVDETGKS